MILAPLLPLLAAKGDHCTNEVLPDPLPPQTVIDGMPCWTFNGHTRVGKHAFRLLVDRSTRLRAFLNTHRTGGVTAANVVAELVFRLESGCLNKRLQWGDGLRFKLLSESLGYGIPDEAVAEARQILLSELDLLNLCRADALADYLR